jgi:hypothetical protein
MNTMKILCAALLAVLFIGTATREASAQAQVQYFSNGTRNCQVEPEQFRERCEARNRAILACINKKDEDRQLCVADFLGREGQKKQPDAPKKK